MLTDQEELKECLKAKEIPANSYCFEQYYRRSLRCGDPLPTRALNRYYNL